MKADKASGKKGQELIASAKAGNPGRELEHPIANVIGGGPY